VLIALATPVTRYVNTVLGGWLLVSTYALPSAHLATMYNSTFVAVLIFWVTFVREPDES
jgi:hypothetical protein